MTTRAPRRDAVENRAGLLDAARTVLRQDAQAPIEAIAAAAGLSRRAVYGHFPSRDALLREVVLSGAERVLQAAPATDVLVRLKPVLRLATIASALWDQIADAVSMARLAVRGTLAEEVAAVFAPLRAQVVDACIDGIATGDMRDDVAPEALARLVEGACFAVLDEANRTGSTVDGRTTIILAALGMAGIGWKDAMTVATTGDDK
ncbi:TetR/AcrR family transcriptional regulator [Curtobacterium flaccumfaciens]|uniref:TetR/AcrR family transcriptional regulator n=1 Tax=Curtobacterium flaccumfaciens TaxID=2035 RepID=UPI0038795C35